MAFVQKFRFDRHLVRGGCLVLAVAHICTTCASSQVLPCNPHLNLNTTDEATVTRLKKQSVQTHQILRKERSRGADSGDNGDNEGESHPRVTLSPPRLSEASRVLLDGDLAREAKDLNRALQIYRYVQRINPRDALAFTREAEILYEMGRNNEAEKKSRLAIALKDRNTAAFNVLANCLLAQGKFDEAIRALEQCSAQGSATAWTHRVLADLYAQSGSTEKSDAEFRKVLELAPNDVHAATNLAAHMASSGNVIPAINLCKEVQRKLNSDSAQLQIQLGLLYLQASQLNNATESFKRARDVNPHDPLPFEMLATISGASQDWPGAQDYSQSFADVDKNNVNALTMQTWATYAGGDLQEARLLCQKALELLPDCKLLHQLNFLILTDSKRPNDAAKELESSLAMEPGDLVTLLNKAMTNVFADKPGESLQQIDSLLENHHNIAAVNGLAAFIHLAANDEVEAKRLADRAISLDTADCLARITLARISANDGQFASALEQLSATGPGWQGTGLMLTERANVLYLNGRYNDAQNTAQLALQVAPSSVPAKRVLALSLGKLGNFDGEALFLKEAIGRNPKDMSLRLALGEALQQKGDLDAAQMAYESARKMNNKDAGPILGLAKLALKQKNNPLCRKLTRQALELDPGCLDHDEALKSFAPRRLKMTTSRR